MTMNNNYDRELGWDDELIQDADEFILLSDGQYMFTVDSFERARHTPSGNGKLPACNKAIITILIETQKGNTRLKHNLFLHSSTEGMISAFFGSIGLKKKGEPLKMDWNQVIGKKGICKIGHREYNGNIYNDIKGMIYKDDVDNTKVLNLNYSTPEGFSAVPDFNNLPWD